MSALPPSGPVIKVKPQPNVYTALLFVATVCLTIAIVVGMYTLFVHYGMTFGELFTGHKIPEVQ